MYISRVKWFTKWTIWHWSSQQSLWYVNAMCTYARKMLIQNYAAPNRLNHEALRQTWISNMIIICVTVPNTQWITNCWLRSLQGIIQADYIFEVQFHSYKNPTQRSQANNGCCDANSQLECRSACDTYLYICLTQASNMQVSVPAISQECPFGFLQTDLLVNRNGDNVVFSEGGSLDVSGNTNPSNFQSQGPWLVSIHIIHRAFNIIIVSIYM